MPAAVSTTRGLAMKWEKGFLGSKVVDEPGLEQKLNQLGEKGWELITVHLPGSSTTVHMFKRASS
jgi:hypothetical protein